MLVAGEPLTHGANELRRTLFTLPTHRFVTATDRRAITTWLHSPPSAARRS